MSSAEMFAKNLETAACHAVGVDPLRVRIAELGDEAKQFKEAIMKAIGSMDRASNAIDKLSQRITEMESEAKQAADDEAWAKQNLTYVSMSEDGCWAGMYDRDSGEERGLVERVDTITEAIRALRAKVEGGGQ